MSARISEDGPDQLRRDVRGLIGSWRAAGRFVPRSDAWLRSADVEFSKELAARGLIGMTWPQPYGAGASNVARLAVTEELLRAGAPVAAHWVADRQIGPAILRHGSERLREEILPGIASADHLFCLGMSEPEAGSDLAAVRTRAVEVADGYELTGRKIWTSNAHRATHIYVLARTTPVDAVERKHQGLTEFIVDMSSPGITVTPIVDLAGEHHFNEVTFDHVRVPAHRVLGTAGNGWTQVMEQLSFERGGPERVLSTYPLLVRVLAEAGLPEARPQLGRLIARLAVLRQLCLRIAERLDAGEAPIQEAATCKYLGNVFEHDVIELARTALANGAEHLRGAFGDALLASPGFSIRGGAAEVLLSIITKQELNS
ncbi:acyl-CoA dehydrogenase family protein [Amycolatopsis thermoflava]|uniref:acyl-CoA dehydrogenase family protein n=1 Tax=Amycolatopsis thermoflava TaxID=84480 RepID=UPI00382188D3